ncbi:MAG: MFS transporter [Pseudomonadota bacterium]
MSVPSGRMSASAWSWSLYQGARDPYIILIGTYVFIPYFATAVVGDAVRGQSFVAAYSLISSLLVAFTAPVLGAAVDRMGARKPWLLALTALSIPLIAALWFATPAGVAGMGVLPTLAVLTAISVLLSYGDVFYNAMLMSAADAGEQPSASGWALSLGNAVSIVMLLAVLFAFAMPGLPGMDWLPPAPLFGLDRDTHQPDRIVGPIVAVVFAALAAPLFLFARDGARTGVPFGRALKDGAGHLASLFRGARAPKDVVLYLVARMLYIDGKMALLVFGGVYAAGVMGWGGLELLVLGIVATLSGVVGGVMGGWLDRAVGPREAFKIEIAVTVLALIVQLGTTPARVAYFWPVTADAAPLWAGPMFGSAPEVVYLACAVVISLFGTASWASSRTLMARLTPPEEAGAFFGLFALSQTATMWVGPLLIDVFTRTFKSQPAGFIPIVVMMLAGLVLLFPVKGGGRVAA